MGVWGTAIFSDDIAADVRDAFMDHVAEGLDPTEATERLQRECADLLQDREDANVFWLALAATQWKIGRLLDHVRERAIAIIDAGDDLHRWQGSRAVVTQRTRALKKLRNQLLSPQPKTKRLKARAKSSTDFRVGDVATFRLDDRTAVRFCVLHLWSDRGGTYCDICLLGVDEGDPFLPKRLDLADTLGPHYTMISREPADRITLLARGVGVPEQQPSSFRAWSSIEIRGHACTWDTLPEVLRAVLPRLAWLS